MWHNSPPILCWLHIAIIFGQFIWPTSPNDQEESLIPDDLDTYKWTKHDLLKSSGDGQIVLLEDFAWTATDGSIDLVVNPKDLVCKLPDQFTDEVNYEENCVDRSLWVFICWEEFARKGQFGQCQEKRKSIADICNKNNDQQSNFIGIAIKISAFVENNNIRMETDIYFSYSFKMYKLESVVQSRSNSDAPVKILTLNLFGTIQSIFSNLIEESTQNDFGENLEKLNDIRLYNGRHAFSCDYLDPISTISLTMASASILIVQHYEELFCNAIQVRQNGIPLLPDQCKPNKDKSLREILGDERYDELKETVPKIRYYYEKCVRPKLPGPPPWINNSTQPGLDWIEQGNRKFAPDDADVIWSGDIILTKEQAHELLEQYKAECNNSNMITKKRKRRQAAYESRWPQNKIAVFIDHQNDKAFYEAAFGVFVEIMKKTCINFIRVDSVEARPKEIPLIKVLKTSGGGCVAHVGNWVVTDIKQISTAKIGWCWKPEEKSPSGIFHEVGHSMGLNHEQDRSDARFYVWGSGGLFAFKELTEKNSYNLGQSYDYGSILHYNGFITLYRPYQRTIGLSSLPTQKYSFKDIKMFNLIYCNEMITGGLVANCQHGGYLNPKNTDICECPPGYQGKLCEELANGDANCPQQTELFANERDKTYMLKFKTTAGSGTCYWRIWAKSPMNKIGLKIKQLDGIGCQQQCGGEQFLEIKYRQDKAPMGARICCILDYPYTIDSETDNLVVILKGNKAGIMFELEYKAVGDSGLGGLPSSCNCADPTQKFIKERNPGQDITVWGPKSTEHECEGIDPKKENIPYFGYERDLQCVKHEKNVKILLNGKYQTHPKGLSTNAYTGEVIPNESLIHITCHKMHDGTNIWLYEDDNFGTIRLDEVMCVPEKK